MASGAGHLVAGIGREHDNPIWIANRQRAAKSIHDAEDGGIDPDAEGERENDDGDEPAGPWRTDETRIGGPARGRAASSRADDRGTSLREAAHCPAPVARRIASCHATCLRRCSRSPAARSETAVRPRARRQPGLCATAIAAAGARPWKSRKTPCSGSFEEESDGRRQPLPALQLALELSLSPRASANRTWRCDRGPCRPIGR